MNNYILLGKGVLHLLHHPGSSPLLDKVAEVHQKVGLKAIQVCLAFDFLRI